MEDELLKARTSGIRERNGGAKNDADKKGEKKGKSKHSSGRDRNQPAYGLAGCSINISNAVEK